MPHKDPDERRAYQRAYAKRWRQKNREKARAKDARHAAYIKAWREANPDRVREWGRQGSTKYREKNREKVRARDRAYKRKSAYGITPAHYHGMVVAQAGRCGICGEEFAKTPHVDHDHESGQIRGLLCGTCNVGIAMLRHSRTLLENARRYLERPVVKGAA